MSLSARAKSGAPEQKKRRSVFYDWYDSLPDEERQAAEAMMQDSSWTHPALTEVFIEEGMPPLTAGALANLRRDKFGYGAN